MTRLGNTAAAATALVAAAAFLLHVPAGAADAGPDTTPPGGAVGGVRSPASGTLKLLLYASDTGLGLADAEASLDGQSAFAHLGGASCPEHPTPEPPPGAECPGSVSAVPLPLDTRALPDGPHRLIVRVSDAAANTATLADRTIEVRNAVPPIGTSATVTIGVASQGADSGPSLALRRKEGFPCRSPRLKMRLAARPLWRTRPHHTPVLRFGLRHPYRGRLTCLVGGRRVAAPDGTAVHVTYRIWRRTTFKRRKGPVRRVRKGAIPTHHRGRLGVRLGFPTGRTIIFSYRAPGGEVARAKLRIAIARPDPPAKGER